MGTLMQIMAMAGSLPISVLLAVVCLAAGVPAMHTGAYSPGDYRPDIGEGSPTDYGRPTKPNCHLVQQPSWEDRCEDYKEKTCWTQNKEECGAYLVNTCTPVVETTVDRRCFNVTELICELVESVHYRQVEETFHVQSCYTTKDRVCDTVHEIDTTTTDDPQCVDPESPNWQMEDKILVDKVCTDTVEFECSPDKKLDNAGYGVKDTTCKKVPKHDCYDSPRTVQVEVCEPEYRRYCDKLTKDVPFPVERQNCHFERKKICQLVPKTKPKRTLSTGRVAWGRHNCKERQQSFRSRRTSSWCMGLSQPEWLQTLEESAGTLLGLHLGEALAEGGGVVGGLNSDLDGFHWAQGNIGKELS